MSSAWNTDTVGQLSGPVAHSAKHLKGPPVNAEVF